MRTLTIGICLLALSRPAVGQCGGTERWAVKDGTDSAADQVDVANITAMTISQLVHIKQPHIPNDNTTRVIPQETHVVRVKARLVQWKHESDDDYHLVLADDTLRFTPGHGRPTGHSLIGEIPSPDCLSGASGQFGTDSPLLTVSNGSRLGIASARHQIEQEFPDADMSGAWNDAGGVQVEVVGVEFFDRAHGQVGRAPNNLEIHPILSVNFQQHPQELLASGLPPTTLATPPSSRPLVIQDPNSGETAMITEERALKVASSETAGKSGSLSKDTSSPDLGFPKTLTVCWNSSGNPGKIELSFNGSKWFEAGATSGAGCSTLPPARFVKLTEATGAYQVSY